MTTAYINRIATGVPAHDVHEPFLAFARWLLAQNGHPDERFERMAKMANIGHRYSCVDPSSGFYAFGRFPSTAERMRAFADIGFSAFEGIVTGSKSASDALRDMAKSLADMVLKAALLGQGPLGEHDPERVQPRFDRLDPRQRKLDQLGRRDLAGADQLGLAHGSRECQLFAHSPTSIWAPWLT